MGYRAAVRTAGGTGYSGKLTPRSRKELLAPGNSKRRVSTAAYKLAILAEYDRCSESGEKGALLRREGL